MSGPRFRRALWLVLLGSGIGGVVAFVRSRQADPAAPPAAQWPPLTAVGDRDGRATGTTSTVNALVDTPDARSDASTGSWVAPLEDGTCPPSHPIKANDNSGIFHVPGGRFYDRTNAERCYATADAAAADGYRPAKA